MIKKKALNIDILVNDYYNIHEPAGWRGSSLAPLPFPNLGTSTASASLSRLRLILGAPPYFSENSKLCLLMGKMSFGCLDAGVVILHVRTDLFWLRRGSIHLRVFQF